MAYPASDYEEQSSGARWWGPWRNDTDDYSIVVRGTNNNTNDTLAISNAVTQLNSWGKGKLVLEGTILATGPFKFNYGIDLHFKAGTLFKQNNTVGSDATFTWEPSLAWNPLYSADASYRAFTAHTQTGLNKLVVTDLAGSGITKGDWFLILGDDTLNGQLTAHAATIDTRCVELHQAQNVVAGSNEIHTSDLIVDKYTIRPRVLKVNLLPGPTITGEYNGTQSEATWAGEGGGRFANFIRIYGFKNPRVYNLQMGRLGTGSMLFGYCANIVVANNHFEGTAATDDAYSISAICVNGMLVYGNQCEGSRHFYTCAGDVLQSTLRKTSSYTQLTFTGTGSTDIFTTSSNHGLENGDVVRIYSPGTDANLDHTQTTPYYVANKTLNTFQLSTSSTLTPIFDIATNMTGGSLMQVRAGTCLNCVITGNVMHSTTKVTDAGVSSRRDIMSTHPESYGVLISNNKITVPQSVDTQGKGGAGIEIRGRKHTVMNNTVQGALGTLISNNSDTQGILAYAPDSVIKDNVFQDLTYGVSIAAESWDTVGAGARNIVEGNVFRRISYAVTYLSGGAAPSCADGVGPYFRFINNTLVDCGLFNSNNGDMFHIATTNGHNGGVVLSVSDVNDSFTMTSAHGLSTGVPVRLKTSGTLPTGLAINTTYYVEVVDTVTIRFCKAPGTPYIVFSGTGSGTIEVLGSAPPSKYGRYCQNFIQKASGLTGIDLFNLTKGNHTALGDTADSLAFAGNVFDGWGSSITNADIVGAGNDNATAIATAWSAKNTFV